MPSLFQSVSRLTRRFNDLGVCPPCGGHRGLAPAGAAVLRPSLAGRCSRLRPAPACLVPSSHSPAGPDRPALPVSALGSFSYGEIRQVLYDIERAFAILDGHPDRAGELDRAISIARRNAFNPRQDEIETTYFKVRCFKNGNAHLWMVNDELVRKVNKTLAKYYGEVLADAVALPLKGLCLNLCGALS